MSSAISPISSYATDPSQNPYASVPTKGSSSEAVSKNMFLQLLVAQMKNQDPLNPTDGTQFITQLAQFQQLETQLNTGQDITAIRADLDKLVGTGSAATSDGSNTSKG